MKKEKEADEKLLEVLRRAGKDFLPAEELLSLASLGEEELAAGIGRLRDLGYELEEFPGAGYRLLSLPDRLYPDELRRDLPTEIIGGEIISLEEVDSTQSVARRFTHRRVREGTVVIAESQTEGRGRRGRTWLSPRGKGLWFSLILRPPERGMHLGQITVLGAVAVAEAVRDVCRLRVLIEWPNDIVIEGKKLGGILAEVEEGSVILGIGLNVSLGKEDFPPELRGVASSLEEQGSSPVNRLELARAILTSLDTLYRVWVRDPREGFGGVRQRWHELSSSPGKKVHFSLAGTEIRGEATGIDDEGALLVRTASGVTSRAIGEEVSFEKEQAGPAPGD